MAFIPYLYFDGTCAQAMQFYASVFGTSPPYIQRYSDAPDSPGMAPSDRVIYAHIMLGNDRLMASDYPPGTASKAQSGVAVNFPVDSCEAGEKIFARLRQNGQVTMPFGPTFFTAGFGMLCDQFGTNWMIGVPPDQQDS